MKRTLLLTGQPGSGKTVIIKEAVTQAIDSGKKVLGTIMLNPHPFADGIKRHPEVETFLVTRDNRTEVMNKVLNRLIEEVS